MPKNSAAKIAANKRYTDKAYDKSTLYTPKGQREQIAAAAERRGLSINGYIQLAITNQLEADHAVEPSEEIDSSGSLDSSGTLEGPEDFQKTEDSKES